MSKVLIAFDVDGTLECGSPPGPIKLEKLIKLKRSGLIIGIVGAFDKVISKLPDLDFYLSGDPNKPRNLEYLKRKFNPSFALYVADRPSDREAALKQGFSFLSPQDFSVE